MYRPLGKTLEEKRTIHQNELQEIQLEIQGIEEAQKYTKIPSILSIVNKTSLLVIGLVSWGVWMYQDDKTKIIVWWVSILWWLALLPKIIKNTKEESEERKSMEEQLAKLQERKEILQVVNLGE